jgi:membrane protein DedA with SNARE-associated domain
MPGFFSHLFSVYGYWFVAAAVGIERVGIPLPGETALIAAGVFAGTAKLLNVHLIVLVASVSVFLGNILSYWLGREFGYRLLRKYGGHIGITEARMKLGQFLFLQHGTKLVIAGQFLPLLREVAGFLAGANQVPWRPFLAANAVGALFWSVVFGYGAYGIGRGAENMGRSVGVGLGLFAVIVFVAGAMYLRQNEHRLQEAAEAALPGALPS